jgi:FAD:protein FMN transferase
MLKRMTLVWLLALALAGCTHEENIVHVHGHVFGTQVEVSIYGEPEARAQQLGEAVLREFDRLHHKFHAWQPSELTALNDAIAHGQSYQSDGEMVGLLQSAARLSAQSDNLFNPAIGHLIRLWGFQSSDIHAQGPSDDEIKHWVDTNPRLSDLRYEGTRISSTNRAVMIDLGGYAKGYALDRAAQILRAAHVKAALVNTGGNMIAIGQPGARPWRVAIRDPRGAGALASVELRDNEAIGTSGDDQRYFMKNGKRHPHIIDPRTGQTTDTVASVTIIASGGADVGLRSDGHSKPLFVSGPASWETMARRLGLDEVLIVGADHGIRMTDAMRLRLGPVHPAGWPGG